MSDPEPADRAITRLWVRQGCTRIDPQQAGARLDRYLAQRFTYRSRTQWRRLIRGGRITVNERASKPSLALRAGDLIRYVPRERPEPPVDRAYRILHVDDALVAVAKSGNLPLHPSGRYFRHTLLHLLLDDHPEWGRLHVVHRLDRETSGVVVFGRTRADTRGVAVQFQQRRVEKRYLAIVEGEPREDEFRIDLPLGPATGGTVRKAVAARPDGIAACTEVRVLHRGAYRGEPWAWVEARPLTGRLHQIRVHLRAVGLPVLGDKLYGRGEHLFLKFVGGEPLTAAEAEAQALPRQALHAFELRIQHPRSGDPLVLRAPLADDLAAALRARGLDPSPWVATAEAP